MRTTSRFSKVAAPVLFFLGLLCLAAMGFVAAWPDMEASTFDAATSLMADGRLRALRCPMVIASDEVSAVRAKFTNPTDVPSSFLVRTRISHGFITLVREDSQQVTMEPGGSRELSWPVAADDAAYSRLVMARVLAMRSAGRPARESACGILVVGVSGVSGQWLFAAGVLLGLALAGGGAGWWWWQRRPLGARDRGIARRVGLWSLIVVASLVAGILGWWPVSHLLLIASLLFPLLLLEAAFAPRS